MLLDDPCAPCGGLGTLRKPSKLKFAIPPGVYTGVHVRSPFNGHAGKRGSPAGHAWAHIFVSQHTVFRLEKSNVFVDVPLSLKLASSGGTIQIPVPPGILSDIQV